MKKNKLMFLLTALSVVILGIPLFGVALKDNSFDVTASHVHNGYHYEQKDPTLTESGYKEFWSCCICHESYLTKPAEGTFVNNTDAGMTGGVNQGHVAYLPPTGNVPPVPTSYDFMSKELRTVDMENEFVRAYNDAITLPSQWQTSFASRKNPSANIDTKASGGTQNLGITWTSDGSSEYTVYIADNISFLGYFKTTTTDNFLNDGVCYPGKDYYYMVYGDDQVNAVTYGRFHTLENTTRFVYVPGTDKEGNYETCGFRDLGGFPTMYGTRTKYGMLYRGAQLKGLRQENHAEVNQEGLDIINNYLGIKSEIDLRAKAEIIEGDTTYIDNCYYKNVQTVGYDLTFDGVAWCYGLIFDVLSDESNYPCYFHCVSGADRTGTLSYLLNALLGVGEEDLIRDYELKTFAKSGGLRNRESIGEWDTDVSTFIPGKYSKEGTLNSLMERVNAYFPETTVLSEKVYRLFNETYSIPAEKINAFLRINLGFVPDKFNNAEKVTVHLKDTDLDDLHILKGTSFTSLPHPSKAGYEFEKWVNEDGTPFEITTIINKTTTLVARYKRISNGEGATAFNFHNWLTYEMETLYGFVKAEDEDEVGGIRLYTRETDRYSYSFPLPKMELISDVSYTFYFESHWNNQRLELDGVDITGFFTGQSATRKIVTITRGGKVLVDGVEKMTLSYDVITGERGIIATVALKDLSEAASVIIGDIHSTLFDYNTMIDTYEDYFETVDLDNITDQDIQKYMAYDSCLKNLTPYQQTLYVKPQVIIDFESRISNRVCTVTYIDNLSGTSRSEKVFIGQIHSNYYQYGDMDYEFAYYTHNGDVFDFSTPITEDTTVYSNYYTYAKTHEGVEKKILAVSDATVANAILNHEGSNLTNAWKSTGYTEFGTRKAGCTNYYIYFPEIDFNSYGYVEFKVSPRNSKSQYKVNNTIIIPSSFSTEYIVSISNGKLFVDGIEKVTLTPRVLNGLESLMIHDEIKGSIDSSSVKIYDLFAYKTVTSAHKNIVTYYSNGVETGKQNVLSGDCAYDILACDSYLDGVVVDHFELDGQAYDMSTPVDSDLNLTAIYGYTSAVTHSYKTANVVHELSFDGYDELRALYGDYELTISPDCPTTLTRFTFSHWTDNEILMLPFEFGDTLEDDYELYAVWKENGTEKYIVLANGGKGAENVYTVTFSGTDVVQEIPEGSKAAEIPGPAAYGSAFAYWTYNDEEFDFSTPITQNIVLYPGVLMNSNEVTEYDVVTLDFTTNTSAGYKQIEACNELSNFSYFTISNGKTEFGTRINGVTGYDIYLPKFNFNAYGITEINLSNGWTDMWVDIGDTGTSTKYSPSKTITVRIIGSKLYVNDKLTIDGLDVDILNGTKSLHIGLTTPTNNSSSNFNIFTFKTYMEVVIVK